MVAKAEGMIEVKVGSALSQTFEFLNFAYAVRDAKKGNARLIKLFTALHLDYENHNVISLFGMVINMAPLNIQQALALKEILEIGAK